MPDLTLLRQHPVLASASPPAVELIGGRGELRRWARGGMSYRSPKP